MVDFGHIEHLMGPETGLLTPKTPKLPSEGLMWTNFGPGYQKSSLWVVITDIRHYRPALSRGFLGIYAVPKWLYLLQPCHFGGPKEGPKGLKSRWPGQSSLNCPFIPSYDV